MTERLQNKWGNKSPRTTIVATEINLRSAIIAVKELLSESESAELSESIVIDIEALGRLARAVLERKGPG